MKSRAIIIPVLIVAFTLIYSALLLAGEEAKFLSDRHITNNGMTCADCHDGKEDPKDKASIDSCLECHEGYSGMIERTKDKHPNPHDSHEGDIECNECHKPHGKPVDYCEQCHAFGLMVP